MFRIDFFSFLHKSILLVGIALANVLPAQVSVQQLEGHWWLAMLEEFNLPINLTFAAGSDGGLRPFVYSPLQVSEPLNLSSWSLDNDTLRYTDKQSGVKLTLAWNAADSSFGGLMRQGAMRTNITFRKTDGLFKLVRPQSPVPPFPYEEREVTIKGKTKDVSLSATLTIPQGKGPFPAVVLVSGSGLQNRDEEIMGHKPFAVLADYLTRHGVAVLRYDDRGFGQSKGNVLNATTFDFADDAESALLWLRRQKGIDAKRVGIIGHSEGGMVAPIVASRCDKVNFVVLLAGPGTSGGEILLQQNERILRLSGVPQDLVSRRVKALDMLFDVMDTTTDEQMESRCRAIFDSVAKGLSSEQRKLAGIGKGDAIGIAKSMNTAWMRTFVKLDNAPYLRATQCPILAINGSKDCQVPPINLDLIKRATAGKAEIILLQNLNHLMQHAETGLTAEYMTIEETMSDELLDIVASWILDK